MAPPKGFTPWNKGLTKETSGILQLVSNKNKESVKKIHLSKTDPEKWKEQCKKHSEYMMGENNVMYGKTHSREVRKKISEAQLGVKEKPFTEKHRENISKSKKGKKRKPFSEEWKRKISEANKGELNCNYGKSFIGELNPNWKGGIACEPYCDIWTDKEYKESIKERDGYKCLNPECSEQHTLLHLHHINYNKKDCRPNNIITLCVSCNGKANHNRDWHQSWYQAIINKRYKYKEDFQQWLS